MMPPTGFTIKMMKERETKGAVRYQEVDDDGNVIAIADGAIVGTQYIRKMAFADSIPDALILTVAW